MTKANVVKIRVRNLSGYSREAGGYIGWTEYQVVRGRKIIGRYETKSAAERAIRNMQPLLTVASATTQECLELSHD